jgi:hypothetical protein
MQNRGTAMLTIWVTRSGRAVGAVRYDPASDRFDADDGIPADIVSDVQVTFYRDNVLFGASGDGYEWSDAPNPLRRRSSPRG